MSPIILSRLATPASHLTRRALSCSSSFSSAAATPGAEAAAAKPASWSWKSLSPTTRRYIGTAICVGAVTDSYVLYTYYPGLIGLKSEGAH